MTSLKSAFYKFYFIVAFLLVCFIGFCDYITGWELQFFIFYLCPIGIAAWFGNLSSGIYISLISLFTWGFLDIATGHLYTSMNIFVWNGSIRFIAFILFAFFLSKIRVLLETQRDYINFIVHDLRSPLVTVSSGLSNMEDLTPLDDSQKATISICKVAVQRGLTLINSILDLSRLESKRMTLDIKNINMNEVLESSLEMVSVFAKNQNVLLKKQIDSCPENFYTDDLLLQRILVNLLTNAIKMSKAGDVVSVRATKTDNKIMLSVTDQGRGFPDGSASKVFTKFIQFHGKVEGGMAGSGLGLAFCKLAVKELGGEIKIESREHKGTKVTLLFPNKRC
jgi:signal transduction histidine kinase